MCGHKVHPKFSKTGLRFVLTLIVGVAAFIWLFGALGFRINLTPSYPVGLWRIHKGTTPKRGDLVMFDFPKDNELFQIALSRGYLREVPGGCAPMVKKLAALPGDIVTLDAEVRINGQEWPNGVLRTKDTHDRLVFGVAKAGVVPEGLCWLLSDYNPRSFDSRYFGAVPISAITATAYPIFVWNGE